MEERWFEATKRATDFAERNLQADLSPSLLNYFKIGLGDLVGDSLEVLRRSTGRLF
jgi:hypothetical protein